jgi:outer membrane protein assembly factor BamD (BamD/ComL family)
MNEVEERVETVNNYERRAYELARDNRLLRQQLDEMKFENEKLTTQNNFLAIQLDKTKGKGNNRNVASVSPTIHLKDDFVKQQIYKWSPTQLLSIAEKEFSDKNYKKSAQFFHTYLQMAENHKTLDDKILFQSGIAAYESREYYPWAQMYLGQLLKDYPNSEYFRGAKLWLALAHFRLGDTDLFYQSVDEFRLKYKNTPEWEILRGHYEEITQKYKK